MTGWKDSDKQVRHLQEAVGLTADQRNGSEPARAETSPRRVAAINKTEARGEA